MQAGPALARVLLGDVPRRKTDGDVSPFARTGSIYYNHFKTGRPIGGEDDGREGLGAPSQSRYIDEKTPPSSRSAGGYTTFEYSPPTFPATGSASPTLNAGKTITVEAALTNTGPQECGDRALYPASAARAWPARPRAQAASKKSP